ncbi:RNA polymerase sigma factor RpoH [Desulfuromonas carbonis]|uniref:RNA polymerase sigma factor RpoH n=1 Tax=Desulfuromonas sp. DDH964 TaxID=1823759 RepID=UPI00078D66F8|nr:RNA polymerase sigma factor RpoH [Desulfuromonas sp. DDH964]AMV72823.1 RNA polymerase sigma-32 factor RpoH [Desulfuromonas sp. DDH964]
MNSALLSVTTDSFEHYMSQVHRFPLLSREEENQLALRYRRDGDLEAAHTLICANLRFVVKVANEYRNYGIKLLDLVQEGNIGLMMAVKKFDPERGIRLISYAVWWIRAYIQNFVIRSWSLVRIGTTQAQRKLFFKLGQARQAIERLGGSSDAEALAQELTVRADEIDEMTVRLAGRDASLDVELTEGDDYSLLDTLADQRQSQEELLIERESESRLSARVGKALAVLNPRERHIVQDRILADDPRTLQELADDYGISRERVRQLEKQALGKLKGVLAEAS